VARNGKAEQGSQAARAESVRCRQSPRPRVAACLSYQPPDTVQKDPSTSAKRTAEKKKPPPDFPTSLPRLDPQPWSIPGVKTAEAGISAVATVPVAASYDWREGPRHLKIHEKQAQRTDCAQREQGVPTTAVVFCLLCVNQDLIVWPERTEPATGAVSVRGHPGQSRRQLLISRFDPFLDPTMARLCLRKTTATLGPWRAGRGFRCRRPVERLAPSAPRRRGGPTLVPM